MDTYMKHHYIKIGLFLLLIALNVADAITTSYAIQIAGTFAVELNPITRLIMEATGAIESLVLAKMIVLVGVALFLSYLRNTVLAVLCLVYIIAVVSNLIQLRGVLW